MSAKSHPEDFAAIARAHYESIGSRLDAVRERLDRPLTYAEKALFSHLDNPREQDLARGSSFLLLRPDRVALQDATAQMALLQFMMTGRPTVAVPSTVHCDHLIRAETGSGEDTLRAVDENREVYDFLAAVANRHGLGFWKPGAGIIHQVVLENYAFPGGLMIGTDSHTPNAGGLGMIACGVGGADAVDVMAGLPWEVLNPKLVGVRLVGELSGWTAPKDVILKLAGMLTVKGGTNRIVEYFGPGAARLSCTGKATITNMGAEIGATTSTFPFDEKMAAYLEATDRASVAALAREHAEHLCADPEVEANAADYFDEVVEIDLSSLEPHVVGPHTPDHARPISELAAEAAREGYPTNLTAALIGSCTNSSYEDMGRSAHIARQAAERGVKTRAAFLVTPGSERVYGTIARDGQLADLEAMGGMVLANACGPCIGQWNRTDLPRGTANSIMTSYNRNFRKRNDGSPDTCAFIASPEIVTAMALSGDLAFNPLTDELEDAEGTRFCLAPPEGDELPADGFASGDAGYAAPNPDRAPEVKVDPQSERLQLLTPFEKWDGDDMERFPLLLKAKGKCTTDHISPAGPWLRYRGHLDRISDNMFQGAVNAFTGETGHGGNAETGAAGATFAEIARDYRDRGLRWVVVGDDNYGEGSSREHAAMSPRLLGAAAVVVKSFARIHETNLKKQGVLPLTFVDPADYDLVREGDRVSVTALATLAPGSAHTVVFHHADGSEDRAETAHTLNEEQITWFRAGSALNQLRAAGRAT